VKRTWQLVLALSSSALFLWLAFRGVELASLPALVGAVHPGYVALYTASLAFIQVCRALRWQVLVRPFARLEFAAAFRVSNIGLLLMMILPLRIGELARPYLVRRETGASLSAGIGAVVVERAVDGLLVTVLFFASALAIGTSGEVPHHLRTGAMVALGIFGIATAALIAAIVAGARAAGLVERLVRPLSLRLASRSREIVHDFVSGLRALPDARAALWITALTVAYWAANGFGLWLVMVGFGWDLPVAAGFVLVSVLVIGIMIPAGPGFLGTYQGAILAGLSIFGVGQSAAAAYGLVVYPINLMVVVAFALPYLFTGRAALREAVKAGATNPR
jgi:glycosyltransferase 2 family protein